jgi:RNA polymerase sigma-70 factor, ECF subfamily
MSVNGRSVEWGVTSSPVTAGDALLDLLAVDLDAGFTELVRAYQRIVYSVLARTCAPSMDAEDLTAQAFLLAYRALRGYEPERIRRLEPRPWLVTIALNAWRNAVRGHARQPGQVPLESAKEVASGQDSVELLVERAEERRELADLVARLPEHQRLAVVLRHVCDLPLTEIAQVLGCPVGTAKSHVFRGLQRLRAEYALTAAGRES